MAQPLKPQTLADGTKRWKVQVSVRPFKRITRGGFTSKQAAVEWRDATIAELKKQRRHNGKQRLAELIAARGNLASLDVAGLAREYLNDPRTRELKSFTDRERSILWWADRCGSERVMEFSVMSIRAARELLMIPGRSPATVNRYLAAASKMWTWGILSGLVPQDRAWPKGIKLTEPASRNRYLSDEEIGALIKAASAHGATLRAAIIVSVACGLRKGELLRLTWADIDFAASSVRVLISKTGKRRAVHLPSSAAAALRELKRATVVGSHVFLTDEGKPAWQGWIENRWRKIRDEAGLKDFRWHDLRHSCASILAQNGASLPEIGALLGHVSPLTTARYSHLVAGKAVTGHSELDAKLSGK
jgi:integrase